MRARTMLAVSRRGASRRAVTGATMSALAAILLLACGGNSAPPATAAPQATPAPSTPAPSRSVEPSPSQGDPSPRAELIDVTVNGLRILGHCSGTRRGDQPVVVLQPGIGGPDTTLAGIERHLADHAMVCAWNRPGVGGSDAPAELPRPVSDVVAEMHEVLAAHGINPPYFPIGQSGGAVVAFMFAQAYPDEVAGFVVMNPNPAYSAWMAMAREVKIPEEFVSPAEADYRGQNPEAIDFTGNDRMLSDPLPTDMPYVVMYDEECGQPDCSEILAPEAAIQEGLAQVGAGGRFVWAHGAGHEIPDTEPDLVNRTIDEVWAEATN